VLNYDLSPLPASLNTAPLLLSAPTLEVSRSPSKRLGLLSQLALPYHKLLSRTPSLRSPKRVRPRGAESDPVTPDLADVTWPVTEVLLGSSPPSPRAMRCIEQGTPTEGDRGRK
jgi:hypothetical protein